MAETADKEIREIAHCGYLTFVAADQLHERGVEKSRLDAMVGDLIDFSSIYEALTTKDNLDRPAKITSELLVNMTNLGQSVHDQRIRSMSPVNAMRLTNNLLKECRLDLQLLETKLRIK